MPRRTLTRTKCQFRKLGAQYISIQVDKGRNLAPKDQNGLSDPYLKVYFLDNMGRDLYRGVSKCVKKNLHPDWTIKAQHGAKFKYPEGLPIATTVLIECWDHDRESTDDFMGEITLPLTTNLDLHEWMFLSASNEINKRGAVSGELFINIVHKHFEDTSKTTLPADQKTQDRSNTELLQFIQDTAERNEDILYSELAHSQSMYQLFETPSQRAMQQVRHPMMVLLQRLGLSESNWPRFEQEAILLDDLRYLEKADWERLLPDPEERKKMIKFLFTSEYNCLSPPPAPEVTKPGATTTEARSMARSRLLFQLCAMEKRLFNERLGFAKDKKQYAIDRERLIDADENKIEEYSEELVLMSAQQFELSQKEKKESKFLQKLLEEKQKAEAQLQEFQNAVLCKVCFQNVQSIVFSPCQHLCCCEDCGTVCSACPVCKKPIKMRQKCYI